MHICVHTSKHHVPEQLLQVVRQLGAASISFPRRVERHKDAGILVHVYSLVHELHGLCALLQSTL